MALALKPYTWSDMRNRLNLVLKERSEKEAEMSIVMASIGDPLPEDLLIEILSWLPVKTLLQFKCVSKSWYAIITSPKFITKHLQNYYNTSDSDSDSDSDCLLAQYYLSHAELQLFELLVDETQAYEILFGMPMYASYVCDGIYYLYYHDRGDRALWNPAINELKPLPPIITKPNLPSNLTYSSFDIYGFGLDPVTKDYKVVVIEGYWSTSESEDGNDVRHPSSLLVYSLRTDSWRYWGDLAHDYFLDNNKCYVCVNGVFYWLGLYERDGDSEVIVSFDMATDGFEEIEVPDYEKPAYKSLAVFQDSVALLSVHEINKVFDIWTFFKDGGWTKKITIGGAIERLWQPVGHWKNDKLILESTSRELMFCDPMTQEVRDLGFHRYTTCQGIFAHKESLVSIKDKNGCPGQNEETERESDRQINHSSSNQSDSEEEYFLMYSNDEIGCLFD